MPIPLSFTSKTTYLSFKYTLTSIFPFSLENFIAFDNKFNTILSINVGSQIIINSSILELNVKFTLFISTYDNTDSAISFVSFTIS